jgi:short-subunit dehydrogenase
MKKNIIIIGMGQGLSLGIAEKFGSESFAVGMISRSKDKLEGFKNHLAGLDIDSDYAVADVADTQQTLQAILSLQNKMGTISVLHYNAVDYRMGHLMDETADSLTAGFRVSVANAFAASKALLPDLKANSGVVLLTGGGSGNYPSPDMASISLGKAGIRNLAIQLHEVFKKDNVFVGTVTINGSINPNSATHSPKILAEKFWALNVNRTEVELVY